MAAQQIIQFGIEPATIEQVALVVWRALVETPGTPQAITKTPPSRKQVINAMLRYMALGYRKCKLPLPKAVDDLEAIGEEVEAMGWDRVLMGIASPKLSKFWKNARNYHEVIQWLESIRDEDFEWISVDMETPQDYQAVIYFFDAIGPHMGWYYWGEKDLPSLSGWAGPNGMVGHEVSHWMPLPGPWVGREE